MELSRGTITPHRLFGVRDLGLGNPEPHVDLVIKAFLGIGEAVAARWIQMPNAILLLQMAPENPASGGHGSVTYRIAKALAATPHSQA